MNPPYYKVTVTNLTRNWSQTTTQGDAPDATKTVQLLAPLTYGWAFAEDVIPADELRFTAGISLAAKTATDVPDVQIGDLVTLDIRVGTAGSRIVFATMRVSAADVTLVRHPYAARLQVTMVDLSPDWRDRQLIGTAPNTNGGGNTSTKRYAWRERLAEQAWLLQLPFGAPTSWAGNERPLHPFDVSLWASVLRLYYNDYPGKAIEAIVRTLNSHQPNGFNHIPCTIYSATHPAGYSYIGPAAWATTTGWGPIAEWGGPIRLEAVPAGRRIAGTAGLPLAFEVSGGLLRLTPRAPAAGGEAAQLALDGDWCILPAQARRSRDAVINTVNLLGQIGVDASGGGSELTDGIYTATDAVDVAQRGSLPRDVSTDLYLGNRYVSTSAYPAPWPGPAATAPYYLSDASTRDAPWTYDAFTVVSSLIPQSVAAWLLPLLAPRLPGETDGDGRLVRNLTLYDLAGNIRFAGQPVVGFVTNGQLTITGGDILWSLTTTPGRPQFTGGDPVPVTVGDVQAAGYGTNPATNTDPLIRIADLDYVD